MTKSDSKTCGNCPFRKGKAWYGSFGSGANFASKIEALKELDRQKIFSCHMRNPDRNIFSLKDMVVNDCGGYQKMLENMKQPDTHADIVNCFNETGPDIDLVYWAKKAGYKSELNLI
jgi:hypothetical protein